MSNGYVKLFRKWQQSDMARGNPVVTHLFVHLLLAARWSPKTNTRYGYSVGVGELDASLSQLAEMTGLTVKQVRIALEALQASETVTVTRQGSRAPSVIRIVNFEEYQGHTEGQAKNEGEGHAKGHTKGQAEGHTEGHTKGHIPKKDKRREEKDTQRVRVCAREDTLPGPLPRGCPSDPLQAFDWLWERFPKAYRGGRLKARGLWDYGAGLTPEQKSEALRAVEGYAAIAAEAGPEARLNELPSWLQEGLFANDEDFWRNRLRLSPKAQSMQVGKGW